MACDNFGVRVDDEGKAIDLEIRKLWSNFIIVADFDLWNKFGGKRDYIPIVKQWVYEKLQEQWDMGGF